MRVILIAVMAAAQIGGSFGEARVDLDEMTEDSMIIDLEVEVGVSAEAVVAHFSFGDQRIMVPLLDRGGGVYGVRTELEPVNYVVVFEAVGPGELSDAWTLAALGAEFGSTDAAGSQPADIPEEDLSDETQRFGWLALALGAASLSALAFWVLGGEDKEAGADAVEERDDQGANSG